MYDKKTGEYWKKLITESNTEIAKRAFQKEVMNPQSDLHIFAPDFDLVQIGYYDPTKGELIPQKPIILLNAQALLNLQYKGVQNGVRQETEQAAVSKAIQSNRKKGA